MGVSSTSSVTTLRAAGTEARRTQAVVDARDVLAPLVAHLRTLRPVEAIAQVHIDRAQAFIDAARPITMVLPAFPAKSPSTKKVLGRLPDRAERLSLRFLASLLDDIARTYAPGALLVLCSDGAVFADAVGVRDDDVRAYRDALATMIEEEARGRIELFHLGAVFPNKSADEARAALFATWARSAEEIHARAKSDASARTQLDGIHRFLFEELMLNEPSLSRTKARNATRARAVEVVRRSEAWSRLVDGAFRGAVRLSIHPQLPESDKLGIHVLHHEGTRAHARDAWLTPWHGVAVLREGRFEALMKRSEAEALGARVVVDAQSGRPSHMELS